MKYRAGDKVRVRKDLEVGKSYDCCFFTLYMEDYRGKIVEITSVSEENKRYKIKGSDLVWWSEEMFEPVMTNFDKVKEMMSINDVSGYGTPFCKAIHKMRKEADCYDRACDDCRKWLEQPYEEPKKEILDKQEKEYLSAVIKPFRNRVNHIIKIPKGSTEYIGIFLENDVLGSQDDVTFLPYFKRNSMYEGMELERKYTLEELGL